MGKPRFFTKNHKVHPISERVPKYKLGPRKFRVRNAPNNIVTYGNSREVKTVKRTMKVPAWISSSGVHTYEEIQHNPISSASNEEIVSHAKKLMNLGLSDSQVYDAIQHKYLLSDPKTEAVMKFAKGNVDIRKYQEESFTKQSIKDQLREERDAIDRIESGYHNHLISEDEAKKELKAVINWVNETTIPEILKQHSGRKISLNEAARLRHEANLTIGRAGSVEAGMGKVLHKIKIIVKEGVVQDVKGLPKGSLYDLVDEDSGDDRAFKLDKDDVGIRVSGGAVSDVKVPKGWQYEIEDLDE